MAKILIAEDERDIRDLIAFTLRFAGHEVVAVGNGAEAVEAAPVEMPDLILMDIRLPYEDGYSALRKIRQSGRLKDVPVIAVTAEASQVSRKLTECATRPCCQANPERTENRSHRIDHSHTRRG